MRTVELLFANEPTGRGQIRTILKREDIWAMWQENERIRRDARILKKNYNRDEREMKARHQLELDLAIKEREKFRQMLRRKGVHV